MMNILPEDEHEIRLDLYNAGYIDAAIARFRLTTRWNIQVWREKHNLPRNKTGKGRVPVTGRPRKAG